MQEQILEQKSNKIELFTMRRENMKKIVSLMLTVVLCLAWQ